MKTFYKKPLFWVVLIIAFFLFSRHRENVNRLDKVNTLMENYSPEQKKAVDSIFNNGWSEQGQHSLDSILK